MRWWILALLGLVGCEPKPGELGYEDCDLYDPGAATGFNCQIVQRCCRVVGDQGSESCFYQVEDGSEYGFRIWCRLETDCTNAEPALLCKTCQEPSIDPAIADELECDSWR